MTDADREACVDYSVAELIRTGTTTVMELGGMETMSPMPLSRLG